MTDKPSHGGRVFTDEEVPLEKKPPVLRYPCFADGCPMPGTMFPDQVMGEKTRGTCPWHYRVNPTDIPRVTQQLLAWQCVVDEMNHARGVLTGPYACDATAQDREFASAWYRLRSVAGAWEAELAPTTIKTRKGVDTGFKQSYGDWARHLERFIGARVVEVLSVRHGGAR